MSKPDKKDSFQRKSEGFGALLQIKDLHTEFRTGGSSCALFDG